MADTETKTKTVTIAGISFEIGQPFDEGHTCSAAEAKVLNQVRAENIGNNVRKRINELKDEEGNIDAAGSKTAVKLVAEVDEGYEFTLATVGARRVTDPLEREILSLARSVVANNIKESGKTVKDFREAEGGEERYAQLIEQVSEMDAVKDAAKQQLQAKSGLTELKLS